MHDFILVFRAEWRKLKRSLLLKVSILIPLGLVVLELAGALRRTSLGIEPGVNFWSAAAEYFSRTWLFLLYPLIITLQNALMGEVEYSNKTWKLIFSQPKMRWLVLAAKQCIAWIMAFISLASLFVGMLLFGGLLSVLKPAIHVDAYIPFAEIAWFYLAPFLISFFIISIQTWVSLNWGNFIVSCSTGIAFTLIALFLFEHEYSRYFPWDMPGLGLYRLLEGKPVQDMLLLNLLLAVGFSIISNLLLSHKEVKE